MKKILKYLSLLLPLLVALVSVFAASFIYLMVYYQSYILAAMIQLLEGNPNVTIDSLLANLPIIPEHYLDAVTILQPVVWIVIFSFWYGGRKKKEKQADIKVFWVKHLVILAFLSLGCQLVTIGLMEMILPYFEELMQDYSELMEIFNEGNPYIIFLSTVILGPISEELIFRGVIFKKARLFTSFKVANFLQALLFGIFHMNIVQGIYAFGVGLVMGYVAYKYQTILMAIIFHIFFNGLSYLLFSPTTGLMKVVFLFVGILLLILTLMQIDNIGKEETNTIAPEV